MLASTYRIPLLLTIAATAFSAVPRHDELLWRNPGPVERLDLTAGPGGKSSAPLPPFRFVKEDTSGTHPKVKVRDARGREWSVKFGNEVHSEPFASRIAWAAGYFIEPIHYVPQGVIHGVHGLKRAASAIQKDGRFQDARFQLRDPTYKFMDKNNWSWTYNPFQNTREINGLKVVIALTSNWDNKDARDEDGGPNTAVFEHVGHHPRFIYSFTDWGGSMGHWGNITRRSNWNCADFAQDTPDFVKVSKEGQIQWGYRGKHTDFMKDVSPADVQWIHGYLGRLRDTQLEAALKACGANSAEAACFTRALRRRIEQLAQIRPARR